MNDRKYLLCLLVVITSACGRQGGNTPNHLTQREERDGWKLLFDGQTTNGWKGYNQPEVGPGWIVRDGVLTCQGVGGDIGGDIITKEKYDNFELKLEWKIGEGGNSGIFYHVIEDEKYEAAYETGPEYQLIDDVGFPQKLETWQQAGADYAMYTANEKKTLKPVGEWNTSRIVFDNGHAAHWLNGEKIVEFESWSDDWHAKRMTGKWKSYPDYGIAGNGHIGLQDHGDKIEFRNIKIRPLPKKSVPISLFNGKDLTGWRIHGTERWFVENGELVCESGPDEQYGYLATYRIWKDFDLSVDFKQEADGNSGVFFRSSVDGVKISGWQAEVAPPDHDTGGIYESYGRGWLVQMPPGKERFLKMGEWNTMRIRAVGDRVQTWLNGEEMADLTDEKIGDAVGVIALQIHDGGGIRVKWRNLVIKPL